jgi:hypothetical protein
MIGHAWYRTEIHAASTGDDEMVVGERAGMPVMRIELDELQVEIDTADGPRARRTARAFRLR